MRRRPQQQQQLGNKTRRRVQSGLKCGVGVCCSAFHRHSPGAGQSTGRNNALLLQSAEYMTTRRPTLRTCVGVSARWPSISLRLRCNAGGIFQRTLLAWTCVLVAVRLRLWPQTFDPRELNQGSGKPSTLSDSVRDVNGGFIADNSVKVDRWLEQLTTPSLSLTAEFHSSPAYAVSCEPHSEGVVDPIEAAQQHSARRGR
ncbi:unnamed protein product [Schistocephalus solidus]|uniref:Uncharacterized protein n=1 Tax=Schistocephalus solidus TaxID=70667 RepID=A0A183STQ4_SCHSO|nr:unnamed protein product [Schistocephalus solidus]